MVPVTIRTKPDRDGTIHERQNLHVVKLMGNVIGFIYEREDNTRHMYYGIMKNTVLIMDNIEYDMGNDFKRKKFKEDFLVLNALDRL